MMTLKLITRTKNPQFQIKKTREIWREKNPRKIPPISYDQLFLATVLPFRFDPESQKKV